MRKFALHLLLTALAAVCPPVWAQSPASGQVPVLVAAASAESPAVGRLAMVVGPIHRLEADGRRVPLQLGDVLRERDRVATGPDALALVVFSDDARMALRADTEVFIKAYRVDPKGQDTRLDLELVRGTVRQISGQAARARPDRYRLNTPIAAIGVRGTDFLAKTQGQSVETFVHEGAVVILPPTDQCPITAQCPIWASARAGEAGALLMVQPGGQVRRGEASPEEIERIFGIKLGAAPRSAPAAPTAAAPSARTASASSGEGGEGGTAASAGSTSSASSASSGTSTSSSGSSGGSSGSTTASGTTTSTAPSGSAPSGSASSGAATGASTVVANPAPLGSTSSTATAASASGSLAGPGAATAPAGAAGSVSVATAGTTAYNGLSSLSRAVPLPTPPAPRAVDPATSTSTGGASTGTTAGGAATTTPPATSGGDGTNTASGTTGTTAGTATGTATGTTAGTTTGTTAGTTTGTTSGAGTASPGTTPPTSSTGGAGAAVTTPATGNGGGTTTTTGSATTQTPSGSGTATAAPGAGASATPGSTTTVTTGAVTTTPAVTTPVAATPVATTPAATTPAATTSATAPAATPPAVTPPVTSTAAAPVTAATPEPAPEPAPLPKGLAWTRPSIISAGAVAPSLLVPQAQATAGRQVTVGEFGLYNLWRDAPSGNFQFSAAGRVTFGLAAGEAFYTAASAAPGGAPLVAAVQGAQLSADFNAATFSTSLKLGGGAVPQAQLTATGTIGSTGLFVQSNSSQRVAGAFTADGREAGYLFNLSTTQGDYQGLTLWSVPGNAAAATTSPGGAAASGSSAPAAGSTGATPPTSNSSTTGGTSAQPATPAATPAPVPAAPAVATALTLQPLPTQLVWGRYSTAPTLPVTLAQPFEQASAGRRITVGEASQYGLWRSGTGSMAVDPLAGEYRFGLSAAQAFYTAPGATAQVATVQEASLTARFDTNRFSTALRLGGGAVPLVDFSASGTINAEGYFLQRNADGQQSLAGAFSLNGREAGYTFQLASQGGQYQGITLWAATSVPTVTPPAVASTPASSSPAGTSAPTTGTTGTTGTTPAPAPTPIPAITFPAPPPVTDLLPLPTQLVWGRFSTPSAIPITTVPYEQASAGRHVTVGELGQYALWRSGANGTLSPSLRGEFAFRLANAEIFYTPDGGSPTAAVVSQASLTANFDTATFRTALQMGGGAVPLAQLQVSGKINDEGIFNGRNADNTQQVAGTITRDGTQAGYLLRAAINGGQFQGVTLWGRRP